MHIYLLYMCVCVCVCVCVYAGSVAQTLRLEVNVVLKLVIALRARCPWPLWRSCQHTGAYVSIRQHTPAGGGPFGGAARAPRYVLK
jgi:hypothetical protein